jgi:UTP--glucose-1-phosphate uridylyltransferase
VDDVLLVTSRDKRAIEDHFDKNSELEQRLAAGGKSALLVSLTKLMAKVKIHAVRQPELRGLGDAIAQARRHVDDEPFLCLLGDTIFSDGVEPAEQLTAAYRALGTSIVGLEQVPAEKVGRYGIIGGEPVENGFIRITNLVEKPTAAEAPSRFAIAARYVLTPGIFDCLDQTKPGKNGEIQLTDGLRLLLEREPIHGVVLKAKRHDIGNPVDWLKTNLEFAANDPELWKQIAPLLRELMK